MAADGLEALAREYPYALVATDHEMPGLSGLELVIQLRQLQPDANYALVTGRPDAARDAAKISGLSAVIKKPWTDSDLMTLVANAVREAYHRQTSRQALTRPELPATGSFVLLLKSDDAHAASMTELLEHSANERYRVVRARNLSEACGYLKTRDYEVILSGLELPDAHGLPTVTELHAVSPGTPILVVRGSEDKDLALAAVQAGAQDYLVRANVDGNGVSRAIRYAVERKRIEKRLSELAHFDQLTQLANRSLLNEPLTRALARSSRTGRRAALLLIDLDHFKAVNDTYGHGAGDRLLVEVAHRVLGSTRSEDTVARIGGDEFAVLLEELDDLDGARRVAQRILNAFATNLVMDGRVLPVTASVGIAIYPDHATSLGDLMRLADAALYQAKDTGKHAYCAAGQDGCDRVSRRAELERELLGALDAGRFSLALQPLCRVADRSVCGHGAFLRWDAADGRQVNAREFLAVLDETGDIEYLPIDFTSAQDHRSRWRRLKPGTVSLACGSGASATRIQNWAGFSQRDAERRRAFYNGFAGSYPRARLSNVLVTAPEQDRTPLLGTAPISGVTGWSGIFGDPRPFPAHELGHNLGLDHIELWNLIAGTPSCAARGEAIHIRLRRVSSSPVSLRCSVIGQPARDNFLLASDYGAMFDREVQRSSLSGGGLFGLTIAGLIGRDGLLEDVASFASEFDDSEAKDIHRGYAVFAIGADGKTLAAREFWSASDANGDQLRYCLSFRDDERKRSVPLACGIRDTQSFIPFASLPGCEKCSFEVTASDGVRTASVALEAGPIENHPPLETITSAEPGRDSRRDIENGAARRPRRRS